MTRVYGYSDDLVEVQIDTGEGFVDADEIDCYDRDVKLYFTDGTIAQFHYGKGDKAIWQVRVLEEGEAEQDIEVCSNEDDDIYSDILIIQSELESYDLVEVQEPSFDEKEAGGSDDFC